MAPRQADPRQPYMRDAGDLLSSSSMYVRPQPIPIADLHTAINEAFKRSLKTKKGSPRKIINTPQKLVDLCLKHLKERTDPVAGIDFYSSVNASELFDMDAISHEMQRQRMQIGIFYQYLIIELMEASRNNGNCQIMRVSDGDREGDVIADIMPANFPNGLRLYMSVKKSSDTVGGQDVKGAIERLEKLAKQAKNLTSPYLCVIAIATPTRGKILGYDQSRSIRYNQDGHAHSQNCEIWEPGFIFPYISGRSASEIYMESQKIVRTHMPFYSLKFRAECNELLKSKLKDLEISNTEGIIVSEKLFEYVIKED